MHQYQNVGVTNPNTIQIDYPASVQNVVERLVEDYHGNAVDYNEAGYLWSLSADLISQAELSDVDTNHIDLQDALIARQLPFTYYVANEQEHWERMDCRWIDGEYVVHNTTAYYEAMDTHFIQQCIEAQAFTALAVKAKELMDSIADRPFTSEDFAKAKVAKVKEIVTHGSTQ